MSVTCRAASLLLVILASCEHRRSADPGASASPSERRCHLSAGAPIPLASEMGQKLEVASGTRCVILDAAPALTRVRLSEGPYAGTVGWTQSGIVVEGDAK